MHPSLDVAKSASQFRLWRWATYRCRLPSHPRFGGGVRPRFRLILPTSSETRPGRPVAAIVPTPREPTSPPRSPSPEDWDPIPAGTQPIFIDWDAILPDQPPAFVIIWDALPAGPPAPPPPANLPPIAYFPAGMNIGHRPNLPPLNPPPLNPQLLNPPPLRPPNYVPILNHDLGVKEEQWG